MHRNLLERGRMFYCYMAILLSLLCMGSCSRLDTSNDFDDSIAFVSDRYGGPFGPLFIMDTEGRDWQELKNTDPSLPRGMTWSPDGMILAFEALILDETEYHGLEGIVLVTVGKDDKQRTTYGPCRYSPAWSPDGRFLAFYTDCGDKSSLCIATPERGRETELVTNLPDRKVDGTHYPMRISWSPDSQFLVYDARDEEGQWNIWTVSRDGTSRQLVTVGREPAWSPTHDEIAFERDQDIWILSLETGEGHKLVDDPVRARWPAWSPTGDQLVFVSWRDASDGPQQSTITNTEIYRINRDGSGLVKLTHNVWWDAYPAWRPASSP